MFLSIFIIEHTCLYYLQTEISINLIGSLGPCYVLLNSRETMCRGRREKGTVCKCCTCTLPSFLQTQYQNIPGNFIQQDICHFYIKSESPDKYLLIRKVLEDWEIFHLMCRNFHGSGSPLKHSLSKAFKRKEPLIITEEPLQEVMGSTLKWWNWTFAPAHIQGTSWTWLQIIELRTFGGCRWRAFFLFNCALMFFKVTFQIPNCFGKNLSEYFAI